MKDAVKVRDFSSQYCFYYYNLPNGKVKTIKKSWLKIVIRFKRMRDSVNGKK